MTTTIQHKPSIAEIFLENDELKARINLLTAELDNLKQKIITLQKEKGDSGLDIQQQGDMWQIKEYRFDREAKQTKEYVHMIPDKNVKNLWEIIQGTCKVKWKITYRQIVPFIIDFYQLDKEGIDLESFNGGKNRKKYAEVYYFCVKILQSLGHIHYSPKGIITRIKE